jgi:DNA-binding protein HU-beta
MLDRRLCRVNKDDLVERIADACGISETKAATAIDTAVDSIRTALVKGDRVALIGFGTFSVSRRKARNGRNPQTGATIKIAARRVAKFTPGGELKASINRTKSHRPPRKDDVFLSTLAMWSDFY